MASLAHQPTMPCLISSLVTGLCYCSKVTPPSLLTLQQHKPTQFLPHRSSPSPRTPAAQHMPINPASAVSRAVCAHALLVPGLSSPLSPSMHKPAATHLPCLPESIHHTTSHACVCVRPPFQHIHTTPFTAAGCQGSQPRASGSAGTLPHLHHTQSCGQL